MNHCTNCGTDARIIDVGCGDPGCCGITYGRDCACPHDTELCSGEGDDECTWCLAPPKAAALSVSQEGKTK